MAGEAWPGALLRPPLCLIDTVTRGPLSPPSATQPTLDGYSTPPTAQVLTSLAPPDRRLVLQMLQLLRDELAGSLLAAAVQLPPLPPPPVSPAPPGGWGGVGHTRMRRGEPGVGGRWSCRALVRVASGDCTTTAADQ